MANANEDREELRQSARKPSKAMLARLERKEEKNAKKEKRAQARVDRSEKAREARALRDAERVQSGNWRNERERQMYEKVLAARPSSSPGGAVPLSQGQTNPLLQEQKPKPKIEVKKLNGGKGEEQSFPPNGWQTFTTEMIEVSGAALEPVTVTIIREIP